jgi:hypothetical protein
MIQETSAKATDGQTAASSSSSASRPGNALSQVASCAAILLSIGLLCMAAVQRLRGQNDVPLTWVAVRAASVDAAQTSPDIRGLPERETGEAAQQLFTADLTALGTALDDPDLGKTVSESSPSRTDSTVVPPARRWQFHFPSGLTEGHYARQLDSLGMELGVFTDDGKILYASELAEAKAKTRTASRDDETRLYFTWDRGDLLRADQALLERAGIRQADPIVFHFCPDDTMKKLATLEQEYKGRKPLEIQRTVFSIKRTFRGYEVYVKEQVLR